MVVKGCGGDGIIGITSKAAVRINVFMGHACFVSPVLAILAIVQFKCLVSGNLSGRRERRLSLLTVEFLDRKYRCAQGRRVSTASLFTALYRIDIIRCVSCQYMHAYVCMYAAPCTYAWMRFVDFNVPCFIPIAAGSCFIHRSCTIYNTAVFSTDGSAQCI